MKKIVNIVTIFLVLFVLIFPVNIFADELYSINVTTSKQTVHPGETVKVDIEFGEELGSYTVDVAYDNNLLEYVSSEGGTDNDNGSRIRVYFYDSTGGSSPRSNMSVTFKAKENITTSNPTDLSITAEGLANSDASVTYDDITSPIVKNIVVEPIYVDYDIKLDYTGDIVANEEKNMKLTISSSMGKNYEHTRIIAEATSDSGGTAKLLATDEEALEHDIIQSGWGDASGDPIGGKNVAKELDVRGLFTKAGEYSITIKLIDRDSSDSEIASETFKLTVNNEKTQTPPTEEDKTENNTVNNETNNINNNTIQNNNNNIANMEENNGKNEIKPTKLPKTGNTIYFVIAIILVTLGIIYISLRKKQ